MGAWRGLNRVEHSISNNDIPVTVIIPFRNEEKNIPVIIESLKNLTYTNIDILFVNDHSTDHSAELFQHFSNSGIKLLHLHGKVGKKAAIELGVRSAKTEILLITDADSRLPSQWVETHLSAFAQGSDFNFGPVRMDDKGTGGAIQAQEFATLIGVGAATFHLGIPTMANGANMGIKKSVFEAVKGYEGNREIPGGDDEFLLKKVFNNYRVTFLKNPKAIVNTPKNESWKQFFHQKIRWASKWRHNNMFIGLYLFLLYSVIIINVVCAIGGVVNTIPVLVSLMLKMLVEGIYIFSIQRFLQQRFSIFTFLLWQIMYPLYVIIFGILANFTSYTWKDRKYGS